jgi:ketosteroid isomerase-like protein
MTIPRPSRLALVVLGLAAWLASAPATRPSNPSPSPDTAGTATEKAVLAANAGMIAAANRLDVDAFFDYIVDSDRGLIVQNGVIFRTRREAYEAVKRGLQGLAKIDRRLENPQVTVIAPGAALLVADGSVDATFTNGRVTNSRFAVSLVFVLRDGRWKVLHGHYSMQPDRR